MVENSYI